MSACSETGKGSPAARSLNHKPIKLQPSQPAASDCVRHALYHTHVAAKRLCLTTVPYHPPAPASTHHHPPLLQPTPETYDCFDDVMVCGAAET